jgi:hypothetical protein
MQNDDTVTMGGKGNNGDNAASSGLFDYFENSLETKI